MTIGGIMDGGWSTLYYCGRSFVDNSWTFLFGLSEDGWICLEKIKKIYVKREEPRRITLGMLRLVLRCAFQY